MTSIIFALVLAWPIAIHAAVDWDALINQSGGSRVHFGSGVEGPAPYRRNPAEGFAPASTAKLFTSSAILEALGEDYRYPTVLQWRMTGSTAVGLRLVGSGDPSWGLSELGEGLRTRIDAITAALHAQGVRAVEGEILVEADDPRWDRIEFPFGWKSSDPLGCGGAISQGFNLNLNCATLVVASTRKAYWREPGVATPIEMKVRPGRSTSISVQLYHPTPFTLGYSVSGTWKSGSRSFTLPVWNVKDWVKNLLVLSLKNRGIALNPGPYPPRDGEARELRFLSPPLSIILKPYVKNSINLIGDALLKTIGQSNERITGPGLLEPGLDALKNHMLRAGVPAGFELYDGSGLSRLSRITPEAMITFLHYAKSQRGFMALWNAMPIAGVDGTLRNRMKGTAAAGLLRAKTGTLNGVYNLAGFVPEGNSYVPFLMLTNTTVANSGVSRAAADRVGARLAKLLHPERTGLEIEQEPIEPFPFVPEHSGERDDL